MKKTSHNKLHTALTKQDLFEFTEEVLLPGIEDLLKNQEKNLSVRFTGLNNALEKLTTTLEMFVKKYDFQLHGLQEKVEVLETRMASMEKKFHLTHA